MKRKAAESLLMELYNSPRNPPAAILAVKLKRRINPRTVRAQSCIVCLEDSSEVSLSRLKISVPDNGNYEIQQVVLKDQRPTHKSECCAFHHDLMHDNRKCSSAWKPRIVYTKYLGRPRMSFSLWLACLLLRRNKRLSWLSNSQDHS